MRSATAQLAADRFMRHLEQLAHHAHPVLDGAAVGVGALILFGQQEFVGQIPHAGIHVHDVEARLHGAARAPRPAS